AVITALLVLVADEDGDRRAGRPPLEDTREEFGLVALLALGHDRALPWPAAVEVHPEVVYRQREPRWATVDDDEIAWTVALTGGRDTEGLSEAIAGHAARSPLDAMGDASNEEGAHLVDVLRRLPRAAHRLDDVGERVQLLADEAEHE